MQKAEFDELRGIIYDKSGINIKEGKKSMVVARIGKRLRALQLKDERAYVAYLEQHADEVVELLNVISTNVTHFYREAAHFDALTKIVSNWAQKGQKRFRVWCAAASSGEEPYTLAITLNEVLGGRLPRPDAKILATDISTRVLEQCKAGQYRAEDIEPVPTKLRERYFKRANQGDGNLYQVRADLQQMILFRRLNLINSPFPMKGPFDVVFCRNVMIYFDKPTKAKLLKEIYKLLRPDGYLFISHTESLTGVSEIYHRVGPSIYQKPG